MGRGYGEEEIRRRLVDILADSDSGMSGTELASRMGVSRITVTKYLESFAQRGVVQKRPSGNITIWYLERGAGNYSFPQDYFKIGPRYLDLVTAADENGVFSLAQNCIHAGARPYRLVSEVVLPAIESVDNMYREGKIGGMELRLFGDIMSRSLHLMNWPLVRTAPTKNCILMAAEPSAVLRCEAASAALYSEGWRVHCLGDLSGSADVFFDLDLQKLLGRVWRGTPGVMVLAAFGGAEEALRFIAGAVRAVRKNSSGEIRLAFCGETGGKRLGSNMASASVTDVLQWCGTVHDNHL